VQVADDVDAVGAGAVDRVEVRAQEIRALHVAPSAMPFSVTNSGQPRRA
jgi:hypothetical protein